MRPNEEKKLNTLVRHKHLSCKSFKFEIPVSPSAPVYGGGQVKNASYGGFRKVNAVSIDLH
jgi:hypothetical protein